MALVLLSACSLYFGGGDATKKKGGNGSGSGNGTPDAGVFYPDAACNGVGCYYPDGGCYGSGCYYPDAAYDPDAGGCNGVGCYPDAAIIHDAGQAPDCHL